MKLKLYTDWLIFASAAVFYLFGHFVGPYYSRMQAKSIDPYAEDPGMVVLHDLENTSSMSKFCFVASVCLLIVLVGRIVYRFKMRNAD